MYVVSAHISEHVAEVWAVEGRVGRLCIFFTEILRIVT